MESFGLQKLVDRLSSGLNEYNRAFKMTQEAHRQVPVSKMSPHSSLPRRPPEPEIVEGMVPVQTQTWVDSQTDERNHPQESQPESPQDIESEGEDLTGDGNGQDEDGGSEGLASETGSIGMMTGETAEDFQMDDYEDYWPAHDEESWIDDLAIFND